MPTTITITIQKTSNNKLQKKNKKKIFDEQNLNKNYFKDVMQQEQQQYHNIL